MSFTSASSLPADAGQPSSGGNGDPPPSENRRFQHYEVLRRQDGTLWELGRGTMGITYKAVDTNLRSEVALKVVNSTLIDHPNARERFKREARAAAALSHHNVASVYHLGVEGDNFSTRWSSSTAKRSMRSSAGRDRCQSGRRCGWRFRPPARWPPPPGRISSTATSSPPI